jgi:Lipase (class 3)
VLAGELAGLVQSIAGSAPSSIVFTGFSWGGAAALIAAVLSSQQFPQANVYAVTFGSPKPGDSTLASRIAQLQTVRVFASTDPIPLLPPNVAQCPSAYAVLPLVVTAPWLFYAQTGLGIELRSTGISGVGQYPSQVITPLALSLVQQGFSTAFVQVPGHDIAGYGAALRVSGLSEAWPAQSAAPSPAPVGGETTQPPLPPRGFAFNLIGGGGASSMAYIAPALQARTALLGSHPRIYAVQWMGQIIAQCDTKSAAHTIARNVNRMCRRLLVDAAPLRTISFGNAISAWITAAAAGPPNAVPALATTAG